MRKLITLLILGLPLLVEASGYSGKREITQIHQRECSGANGFEIKLSEPHSNPDQCTNTQVVNLSCDSDIFAQASSIALTAMIADKKVEMWVSGCDSQGQANVQTILIVD